MDIDASDSRIDSVFLQKRDYNVLNLIGYWFCKLCNAERRYHTAH